MTSNGSIANGLIARYAGSDRAEVLKLLQQAADAARADQLRLDRQVIMDHLRLTREIPRPESRVEQLKRAVSIKTIIALLKML